MSSTFNKAGRRPPVRNQYENCSILLGTLPGDGNRTATKDEDDEEEIVLSGLSSMSECSEPDKIARFVIQAIRKKDIPKLQQFLSEYPMLHLYRHVDQTGVSTIEWAVAVDSTEILGLLLEKSPYSEERLDMIVHALKISVTYDKLELVKYLLVKKSMESQCINIGIASNRMTAWSYHSTARPPVSCTLTHSGVGMFEDARFSGSVSPVILAAQLMRHDILNLLLKHGESDIHAVTVQCARPRECTMYRCSDSAAGLFTLEVSHALLQKYDAISSPCFLLSAEILDPINEAFQITVHLEALSREDPAFKNEYQEIAQKVRNFIWDFTSLCRTSEEIDTLIYTESREDISQYCVPLKGHNRIQTAVSLQQKEFLTHPHIQKFLQKSWYAGVPKFVSQNNTCIGRIALLLLYMLCYPVLVVLYLFRISDPVCKLMDAPALKFVSHVVSYMVFLTMLFVHATKHDDEIHDDTVTSLGILIPVWIGGMLFGYCKCVYSRVHSKIYCGSIAQVFGDLRVNDGFILVLFLLAVIGQIVRKFPDQTVEFPIKAVCSLYAIANLLAFLRICTYMNESNVLGPLYISLKRVALDTCKFGILVVIFMLAFIVANIHLKNNSHTKDSLNNATNGTLIANIRAPGNEYITLRYLTGYFWALFGYGDPDRGSVLGADGEAHGVSEMHSSDVISVLAYVALCLYMISVPLVLLNMLIAMMANSYTRIEVNSDSEWKLARSRLRVVYMHDMGAMPPPLNLILVPYIIDFIKYLCRRRQIIRETAKRRSSQVDFQTLMSRLTKRYWSKQNVVVSRPTSDQSSRISKFSLQL